MTPHHLRLVPFALTTAALLAASACSTSTPRTNAPPPATAASPSLPKTEAPAPGSKFAQLKPGMDMEQVQAVLGRAPDRSHSYETGKRWIPFYFAPDARRLEALYKGEGCLVFTGGNIWGAAGGELIEIKPDATGACYDT